MGVTIKFEDYDSMFVKTKGNKIIVNDFNYYNVENMETLQNITHTTYSSDTIDIVPRCECGATTGGFMLHKTCRLCGTVVTDPNENKEPVLWLKKLYDVPLINLSYINMLDKLLGNNNYVRWMMDNKYNPPIKYPPYIAGLKNVIGDRTYRNFVDKQEDILIYLINNSYFKNRDKNIKLQNLLNLWRTKKETIFNDIIPLVNKKLFVMEKSSKGKYIDLLVALAIDTVVSWIKAASDDDISERKLDLVTARGICKLAELNSEYEINNIAKKPGALRKHTYSARSSFTFRGVITPIIGPQHPNEVHIPWKIAVTVLMPHIVNKLVKKHRMRYKDAKRLIYDHVNSYNELISIVLDELIAEANYPEQPFPGIPVVGLRNPYLLRGSAQLYYITKVKKNPNIPTISFPITSIAAMNGDYDGDEINFYLLLDRALYLEFKALDVHYNVPTLDKIGVSGNLTLFKGSNSILQNYLKLDTVEKPEEDVIYDLL